MPPMFFCAMMRCACLPLLRPGSPRKARLILIHLCLVSLLLSQCRPALSEQWWGRKLAPGVDYYHIKMGTPQWPNHVHVLKIDVRDSRRLIRPLLAYDHIGRLEKVSQMCHRTTALAAVNGSFYISNKNPPLPIGLVMLDGKVLQKTKLLRTTLGIKSDGQAIIGIPRIRYDIKLPEKTKRLQLWGINRPRKQDEVVLYTPEYGRTTRTNRYGLEVLVVGDRVVQKSSSNTVIPHDGFVISFHGQSRYIRDWFELGDRVLRSFELSDEWADVYHALSGGPRLVVDGEVSVTHAAENFGRSYRSPNPRTAVGTAPDGQWLFVVVDGRQPGYSVGLTFPELGRLMVRMGARDAMGLDSGGSSVMVVKGQVVNSPSDGRERRVSNGIGVFR